MSDQNCAVTDQCLNPNSVSIIRGSARLLKLRFRFKETGAVKDLTGVDEITVTFPGESAPVVKTKSGGGVVVTNEKCGEVEVTLLVADTNLLKVGNEQDFEAIITKGTQTDIVQFIELLNVIDKIF